MEASCSGTRWRGNLIRSLLGNGLFFTLAGVSLTGHPSRLQGALSLVISTAQTVQLSLRVGLKTLDTLALLFAVHIVALHQYLEVDARRIELRAVNASELALVVD